MDQIIINVDPLYITLGATVLVWLAWMLMVHDFRNHLKNNWWL